jgi:hypothetical protein
MYSILIGFLIGIEYIFDVYRNSIYTKQLRFFLFHCCSEGVAILLLHQSLGYRAIRTSIFFGIIWGALGAVIPGIIFCLYGFENYMKILFCVYGILFSFYSLCLFLPSKYLHRRPALVDYSKFYFVSNALMIFMIAMSNQYCDQTICYVQVFNALIGFLNPFIIVYSLLQDSLFWQGLYSSKITSELNQPLLGIWELNPITIMTLTESMNQLEKKVVPLIPFTLLRLDITKFFPGGSARVYRGEFKKLDVAIKILFCIELTPQRIVEFCNEASLLYSLNHHNIVKCYGVSIMPPAISLITEYCAFGSLFDFLYNTDIIISEKSSHNSSYLTQSAKSLPVKNRRRWLRWPKFISNYISSSDNQQGGSFSLSQSSLQYDRIEEGNENDDEDDNDNDENEEESKSNTQYGRLVSDEINVRVTDDDQLKKMNGRLSEGDGSNASNHTGVSVAVSNASTEIFQSLLYETLVGSFSARYTYSEQDSGNRRPSNSLQTEKPDMLPEVVMEGNDNRLSFISSADTAPMVINPMLKTPTGKYEMKFLMHHPSPGLNTNGENGRMSSNSTLTSSSRYSFSVLLNIIL